MRLFAIVAKFTLLLIGCATLMVSAAALYLFLSRTERPLQLWHTETLTAEFTADQADDVRSLEDYRRLEDRLFAQLEEKIYARTGTGPAYALVRYSTGSAADPKRRKPDWNRTFDLPAETPVGGVLLLHGMSDSPYSLRALGEALNRRGYWVLGLRLPGHGTIPSGLLTATWEDMAAAVRLGVNHLAAKIGQAPIHVVGYSTGAPLALDYTLDALEGLHSPAPASLDPDLSGDRGQPRGGTGQMAGPAGTASRIGAAGMDASSAGVRSIQIQFLHQQCRPPGAPPDAFGERTQIEGRVRPDPSRDFLRPWCSCRPSMPPSPRRRWSTTYWSTSRPNAHELVLFDLNRRDVSSTVIVSDPGPLTNMLMGNDALPFALTLITNESPDSATVVRRHKPAFSSVASSEPLDQSWPAGVISLSHVALPFPPDDPLYGQARRGDDGTVFLGQIAVKGERGLLLFPSDWLLRLRHNPFYEFLEHRTLEWIGGTASPARPVAADAVSPPAR